MSEKSERKRRQCIPEVICLGGIRGMVLLETNWRDRISFWHERVLFFIFLFVRPARLFSQGRDIRFYSESVFD